MLLQKLVEPYLEQRPYCVLVRAALQRMLSRERLDQLFQDQSVRQYERTLLFSTLIELMSLVVTRVEPSVLAAYRGMREALGVSDEAVYQKLRKVELPTSEAMVRDSFTQASGVLRQLRGEAVPWLRGKRVKILDGNYLSATERRIAELRTLSAAPLPGRALVVWDQGTRLIENVVLTEHGQANERSLLGQVLETVRPGEVWIGDRSFCTMDFLLGLKDAQAQFVIRHHGWLTGIPQGKRRFLGRNALEEKVWEQALTIRQGRRRMRVRRITIRLTEPTREGDTELHILTNLTQREASAARVAELYGRRWTIEVVFLELQTALSCEVETLGYPRAALFAFCVALMLQNTFSMLQSVLGCVHGVEAVEKEVSGVLLAQEVRKTYDGMMVQVAPEHWEELSSLSLPKYAAMLKNFAKRLRLERYRKTPRGPKKPPPQKKPYRNGHHASTFKILALRKPDM